MENISSLSSLTSRSSSSRVVCDILIACSGLYVLKRILFPSQIHHAPYPPGPKPKFIVGNIADFPKPGEQEWVHWAKHAELYGPISHLSAMGTHIVVLSSLPLAQRMLDQPIFSSRPSLPFAGSMCGYENALAMLPYGDRFKVLRKYLHQYMGTQKSMEKHRTLQEVETRRFVGRLLDSIEGKTGQEVGVKLAEEIRINTGSVILKLSHGYTTRKDWRDPLIQLADDALSEFSIAAQPGKWLVDMLPFLRHVPDWMPGASFKQTAKKWRKNLDTIVDLPHEFVKQQVAEGTAFPSFTSSFIENSSALKDSEAEYTLKWAAFAIYGGGADTTVSAIHTFFLQLALNPHIQSRAQAELDGLLGHDVDRLPTFSDRPYLPYIDGLLKEVLRYAPVVPLSLPHASSEDAVFEGYFIPKGTIILPNIWLFAHSAETYRDPHTFDPERFLGENPEYDPHSIAFGFGRRICPGKELADSSLWIIIATVLATLNVTKEEGINVQAEYCPGVISHPKDFPCKISPRSEKALALLKAAVYADDHGHPEKNDVDALANVKWWGRDD